MTAFGWNSRAFSTLRLPVAISWAGLSARRFAHHLLLLHHGPLPRAVAEPGELGWSNRHALATQLKNKISRCKVPAAAAVFSTAQGATIKRNAETFEHTVRAYGADLYRYAWWLCRDRHLAEDVVQETFARAWKSWDGLREAALAKTWLITILRNELARSFSRAKPATDIDGVAEADLPALPSFEGDVETAQIVRLLPEVYREPLLLQVLGGFSCAEIAGMLGTTEGAVMTRLTRARQALRRHYEPDEKKQRGVK